MKHAVAPRLLDIEQAATYIGVSGWTLRGLIADGAVPTVQPPSARRTGEPMRRVLLDREDLDALIERWKAGTRS